MCLLLTTVGCTLPPDPDGPYEGSCPILIECTAQSNNSDALLTSYLDSYGEDGSCWKEGPYQWGACRDSCVAALDSLNALNQEQGQPSCGGCELDSDCAAFGKSARCEDGYCARRALGDIEIADTTDTGDTGTDTGDTDSDTDIDTDGTIDDDCLFDTSKVVLDTSLGVMRLELDSVAAPEATEMFLRYVSANYYDGTIIHRVVESVLIQGGSYGPGPSLLTPSLAPIERLTQPTLPHGPGVIALLPTLNGTHVGPQWYMTVGSTSPSSMTAGVVFGALVEGGAVLDAISSVPVTTVAWLDFQLTNIPEQDVVVHEAYCVAQ
ncbi:Peptidyl-prolyl cis-trans isomerase PpiB [Enhygromyxa salina]|uniref:peptidylprolyl isomerase n=1 Tax=Enhygromyxa salina TaxID=215803 RepID=A0A0C2A0M9_9BACT|nr:Peptidyl-prolyl cis-trans isomerase PpiB [Enhygromyxa salina]